MGTGFTDDMLTSILEQLAPLVRPDPAVDDLRPVRGAVFVEPALVCEVGFLEITEAEGKMRAPSFVRMRPDKLPDECVLEVPPAEPR